MNAITLKNHHFEQPNKTSKSISLFVSFIIVILIFSSSIAYGNDVIKVVKKAGKAGKKIQEGIGLSDKNKQDKEQPIESDKNEQGKEQPIDFLLKKINKDLGDVLVLSSDIKERLKKEFPNELDDKRKIEADIKSNPWYYFFCSNEKRNDFLVTFKKNFQSKKEIIERRNEIYNDFEEVKSFVEKIIEKGKPEPKGKSILISEVRWIKEAIDIPDKFAEINEISITKEKYEPWKRNIPFFFNSDLEILERTKKAKGKIQKILNKKLMDRLERVGELEKIMQEEFPETKDSFSVLKEIKNVVKEAPIN